MKKMTRTLFGLFLALCLGFVVGCGSSGGTTTVDPGSAADQAASDAEEEDYEAQMEEDQGTEGE